MRESLIIGTRGSNLAVQQAQWVASQLEALNPGLRCELVKIKTEGDKMLDVPLAKIGGKGLFVKELDEALLDNQIDLAVHSLKDVPCELHPDLELGAITSREDPRDVLISRDNLILKHLPKDALIGTCSLRRQAQILHFFSDFQIVQLRGNLETRLRRVGGDGLDAVILAAAGIHRLGLEARISEYLPFDLCLPAIGQGALGIEICRGNLDVRQIILSLDHEPTRIAVLAERALLKELEGGCQVPIAAYGEVNEQELSLQAMVSSVKGDRMIRDSITGSISNPEQLGCQLAEKLIAQGAVQILKEILSSS